MINIRSFRDLLRLLFIFQREVRITVLATFVIILLGAFLLPNRYESTALLLVKPGRDSSTVPIELSDRQAIVIPSGLRDPLLDEERMLSGRPIMRAVSEKYLAELSMVPPETGVLASVKNGIKTVVGALVNGVRNVLQFIGLVENRSQVERLAEDLEKNFKVSHEPGSSVMELRFTWNDPEIAQTVLKTWITEYQTQRTKTLGRVSLYAFYEGEVKTTGANIIEYKKQIQNYLNQLSAVSISQRLADTSQGLNDLRTERNNTTRSIASTKAGLDLLKKQLAEQPKTVSAGRELALNPNRQDLQNRINGKEVERQEMLRSFKEEAPPIRAINEEINNLKKTAQGTGRHRAAFRKHHAQPHLQPHAECVCRPADQLRALANPACPTECADCPAGKRPPAGAESGTGTVAPAERTRCSREKLCAVQGQPGKIAYRP
ncbi:hypothetical protein IBA8401_34650 [Pseudomonas syringae]